LSKLGSHDLPGKEPIDRHSGEDHARGIRRDDIGRVRDGSIGHIDDIGVPGAAAVVATLSDYIDDIDATLGSELRALDLDLCELILNSMD
jgi:hypothetical protein